MKKKKKKVCHIEVPKPDGDFTLNKWFHLAVVCTKGKLKVYIEGVEK